MIYRIYCACRNFNKDGINVDWVSPQDYHVDAPYSYNQCIQGKPLPDGISLPTMKKARGAKLTDYLSMGGVNAFMVVSEKLIGSLVNINTSLFKTVEMKVLDKNEILIYHGIHFESSLSEELINWEKSEFGTKKGYFGEVLDTGISILSHDDYLKKMKTIYVESNHELSLSHVNIVLNDISNKYDFFYSSIPYSGLFCSEKFLELIVNNEFTGFHVERVV